MEREPIPRVGDYSVVIGVDGKEECIIKTTKVSVAEFCEVTFNHTFGVFQIW